MKHDLDRVVGSAVLLFCLLLTACQGSGQTPTAEPLVTPTAPAPLQESVRIQMVLPVAVDAPLADIMGGYIDAFESQNPAVTIEPIYSGSYGDALTTIQDTIQRGEPPPTLAVLLATDMIGLVREELILPLDEFTAQEEDGRAYLSDFLPAFLENSYYEDQLWSIPFQRSAVVLYYNADRLAEAGLEPPTSWSEWAETARTLTVTEGETVTWGLRFSSDFPYWLFQPLAIGSGQNIVEHPCRVSFDDPDVIEAVQFYIDLSQEYEAMPEGVQATWNTDPVDFTDGKVAMIAHSSGSLTGILSRADFEVGVMPYPGQEPGETASVTGGGNLYLFRASSSAQQQAAWRFIRFLTEPERVADFSIQTGYIPTRQSAFQTPLLANYLGEVPQASAVRNALQHAGTELATQNLAEVRAIFHDYLLRAYKGEMSPEEAMATAQREAEAALAPYCD